jgi:hypothetical protein
MLFRNPKIPGNPGNLVNPVHSGNPVNSGNPLGSRDQETQETKRLRTLRSPDLHHWTSSRDLLDLQRTCYRQPADAATAAAES